VTSSWSFILQLRVLVIGADINIKGIVYMYSFFVGVMFISLLDVSFTSSLVLTGQLLFDQLWLTVMNYNVLYCDNPKYVSCYCGGFEVLECATSVLEI